jgi:predicted metal-dependent hydrolase
MQKNIELLHRKIEYTLKISRRSRSLRLAVYPGGELIVTAPRFLSARAIEQFIIRKSAWILEKIDKLASLPKQAKTKDSRMDFIRNKSAALKIARQKMEYFNQFYGLKWKRVTIKNQKTRWGSCSRQGNINFNYKIALLPDRAADYIIVHEMCHLIEMNHSRKFWNLVAKTVSDHREIRKELRKNHLTLG